MKQDSFPILSAPNTANALGAAIDIGQAVNLSAHFFFGDATAAGTCKLQVSNDPGPKGQAANVFVPTNWVDLPNIANITEGSPVILTYANASYRWLRAVYVRLSGGSSTVKCNLNVSGA